MRVGAVLAGVLAMVLVGPAAAESAKTAVGVPNVSLASTMDAATIFDAVIHVANDKDLVVDVSFEAGLFTQTLVKSKGGNKDTATASASVTVKVLVDGSILAMPGEVTFASRQQELSASLGGYYDNCVDADGNGITLDECDLLEEEIELILTTMGAHSFNFVLPDLTAGDHTVQVVVTVDDATAAGAGSAEAYAWVGKGSVIVEEVRLTNTNDGALQP